MNKFRDISPRVHQSKEIGKYKYYTWVRRLQTVSVCLLLQPKTTKSVFNFLYVLYTVIYSIAESNHSTHQLGTLYTSAKRYQYSAQDTKHIAKSRQNAIQTALLSVRTQSTKLELKWTSI